MNILFTCAGRRNYLINYFKDCLVGKGKVFAADMSASAPALIDADESLLVPSIYSEDYISEIASIVKEHKINAIISLNDLELPLLAEAKKELESLGATIIVADALVIDIAFDKWKTVEFLRKLGLKTPQTYLTLREALEAIDTGELKFPLVVKPRWGSASIGIDFPEDRRELKLAYELQTIRLKRTILAKASEVDIERAILIQEKLPGKEYGMDVLNDLNGKYFGTYVREKLTMRSGETDKAISVVENRFQELGERLGSALKHVGNMDCDVFEKNGELYVLELNPRFGGGYPFSHEAGINAAAIYIEWLKGNSDVSLFDNYKAGIMFSKCDRLLRVN
ncbi:MAG: ATP-grasp domain-containing protein [Idiomarina sp.]|nr:ATP-grasp domain-containing protein [Idiomarina sp.]